MHHHIYSVALLLLAACGATVPEQPTVAPTGTAPATAPVTAGVETPASVRAPPDDGEAGLAALRQAFNLDPPTGRIERDTRGRWLVDGKTGARLLILPDGEWPDELWRGCARPDHRVDDVGTHIYARRLFEGPDGEAAVLEFRADEVVVHALVPERGCIASATALAPELPEDETENIIEVEWTESIRGKPRTEKQLQKLGDVFRPKPEKATFTGPNDETLTAILTPHRMTIVGAAGKHVLELTHPLRAGRCRTRQLQTLAVATTGQGTWLHLEIRHEPGPAYMGDDETGLPIDIERCELAWSEDEPERDADLWMLIPVDGTPQIIQQNYPASDVPYTRRVRIDNGTLDLHHDRSYVFDGHSHGPSVVGTYRWTFTPTGGGPSQVLLELDLHVVYHANDWLPVKENFD